MAGSVKVAVTESAAPEGVRARTRTAPRTAGACNTPKELMGAVASLVSHATKNRVTGRPPLKPCTCNRSESFRRTKGLRGRITMLSAAGPM